MIAVRHALLTWFGLCGLLTCACLHESAAGPATDTQAPKAASAPDAKPSAQTEAEVPTAASAAMLLACKTDEDCQAVDVYCDACRCMALPAGTSAPKCPGHEVQCVVAPCRSQRAVCEGGDCKLMSGSAM